MFFQAMHVCLAFAETKEPEGENPHSFSYGLTHRSYVPKEPSITPSQFLGLVWW